MSTALELESLARSVNDTLSQLEGEIEGQLSAVISLKNECASVDTGDAASSGENWAALTSLSAKVEAETQTGSLKHTIELKGQEIECKKEVIRVLEECESKLKAFSDHVTDAKGAIKSISDFQHRSQDLVQKADNTKAQALQSLEEDALYGWSKGKNYLEDELNAEIDRAVSELSFYLKNETNHLESYFTHQFLSVQSQLSALNQDIQEVEAKSSGESPAAKAAKVLEAHVQFVKKAYNELTSSAELTSGQIVDLSNRFNQFTSYFKTLAPSTHTEERTRAKLGFQKLYANVDHQIQEFLRNSAGFELTSKSSLFDLVELSASVGGKSDLTREVNAAKEDLNKKLRSLEDRGENLRAQLNGVERTLDREVKIKLTSDS
mmetsp:Transcript_3491/g.7253  ORF Transcript_3491/g.7253 Transcript_3491/m.7253 type:complete len:378 (-) Transcript_3491:23-1156(-)